MERSQDQQRAVKVLTALASTPAAARYLLLGILVNQMGAFVQAFLVLYLVERGLSAGQGGIALTVYSVGAVSGMLAGGDLTHRLGARNTIAWVMGGSAVLVLTIPWLGTPGRYPWLLCVVALVGALMQASRPAAATLLSDVVPEHLQVMAFSMMRIAMNIGAALGPLLAAGFILVNWDLLFWFNGITALVYAALAVVFLPAGGDTAAAPDTSTLGTESYLRVFGDRKFMLYLMSMLLSAVIYVQFYAVLPLHIIADGLPTAFYSGVLATSSGLLIFCELAITARVSRWPKPAVVGIGTVVFGLGLAGYGLASGNAAAILLSTVVFVSGMMISGPTLFAHPAQAPAAMKGRYLGASQATFGIGLAIGPAIGVTLWEQIGAGLWPLCGVIGLIAAVCAVAGVRNAWEQEPALSS